jgi:hypothetical protein
MPRGLRVRFWAESVLASVTGVLAIVTIFWKDWIEVVFGIDPDHGNGSAEWFFVAVLGLSAVALVASARIEWRRSRNLRVTEQ